jgi:ATP-binding cassette subfamily C protein CydD
VKTILRVFLERREGRKIMKLRFPGKYIVVFTLISAVMSLCYVFFGHYLSTLLSDIVVGESIINYALLLWLSVFFILFISIRALYRYFTGKLAHHRIHNMAQSLVHKIDDDTSKQSESLMNAVFVHTDKYRSYEETFIPSVIETLAKMAVIIIALVFVHLNAAIILLLTAPFVPLYYVLVGLRTRDESAELAGEYDDMGTLFLNLVRGKDTVKYTQSENEVTKKLEADNDSFVKNTMAILKYAFQSSLMLEFITILGIGLVALEIGLQIIVFQNISFYAAFFTLLLVPEFYNSLKVMGVEFHNGRLAEGHYEKAEEWLTKREKNTEYRGTAVAGHAVELRDLDIKAGERVLLKDITASFKESGLTAITGPSGLGKSTLLRAIIGLHEPHKGAINVKTEDIGYISDQVYFSDTTIYEYISDNEYEEREVLDILESLNMLKSIQNLEEGVHTQIVNHNIPLSGGEIVRLKMARVLLKRPPIILMDEPTEFLDGETEALVLNYLDRLKKQCAVIAVVHRRKLLDIADEHYQLEHQLLVRCDT